MAKTGAQRQAEWRERVRAAGKCIVCGRKARKGKATCKACNESATKRVYAAMGKKPPKR